MAKVDRPETTNTVVRFEFGKRKEKRLRRSSGENQQWAQKQEEDPASVVASQVSAAQRLSAESARLAGSKLGPRFPRKARRKSLLLSRLLEFLYLSSKKEGYCK